MTKIKTKFIYVRIDYCFKQIKCTEFINLKKKEKM